MGFAEIAELNQAQIEFIQKQKMFFVASAPLSAQGHVNLSPKGYDSFAVLDNNKVAFVDLGGSGAETIAHLKENGRITLMFNAFEGKPLILRLYGQGQAFLQGSAEFNQYIGLLPDQGCAVRSIIVVEVSRVQESCGWSVPIYQYVEDRKALSKYIGNYTQQSWMDRRYQKNGKSNNDGGEKSSESCTSAKKGIISTTNTISINIYILVLITKNKIYV